MTAARADAGRALVSLSRSMPSALQGAAREAGARLLATPEDGDAIVELAAALWAATRRDADALTSLPSRAVVWRVIALLLRATERRDVSTWLTDLARGLRHGPWPHDAAGEIGALAQALDGHALAALLRRLQEAMRAPGSAAQAEASRLAALADGVEAGRSALGPELGALARRFEAGHADLDELAQVLAGPIGRALRAWADGRPEGVPRMVRHRAAPPLESRRDWTPDRHRKSAPPAEPQRSRESSKSSELLSRLRVLLSSDREVVAPIVDGDDAEEEEAAEGGWSPSLEDGAPPPATAPHTAPPRMNPPTAQPAPPATTAPPRPPRYLNTELLDDAGPIDDATPLVRGLSYALRVQIAPERRGPGADTTPVPEGVLHRVWDYKSRFPLTVVVSGADFEIETPVRALELPPSGESEALEFRARAIGDPGPGTLDVALYHRGHLLQVRRVTAEIVAVSGAAPTRSPALDAASIWTADEALDPRLLDALDARVLSVSIDQDRRGNLELRFLDRAAGGDAVAVCRPSAGIDALGTASLAARQALLRAASDQDERGQPRPGYQWTLTGDADRLGAWLPGMAQVGRALYAMLVPDPESGAALGQALEPDAVIQVHPIHGSLTVPWGLVYDRRVRAGAVLCDTFRQTSDPLCPDCKSKTDPKVVCPSGLWGMRYGIEQLPCWTTPNERPLGPLVRAVRNAAPLVMSFNVWRDFALWRGHLATVTGFGRVEPVVAETLDQLWGCWDGRGAALDLVYFYAHGGVDPALAQPYLELSDGRLMGTDLETATPWAHAPLVLLNGCGTGSYGPESFSSLIASFRRSGASGVIGTECPIPELFGEAWARALLLSLFGGAPVGRAMLALRRTFMGEHRNPLGLAYSLYASHDVALATPVAPGIP